MSKERVQEIKGMKRLHLGVAAMHILCRIASELLIFHECFARYARWQFDCHLEHLGISTGQ